MGRTNEWGFGIPSSEDNGGGGGGVSTITAVGSTPNANGGTIAGPNLTLQPADPTNPGVMTATMYNTLFPELFPTLTAPSDSFVLTESGFHEIGESIATLHFLASFNRGSISPAYGTNGFRSGLPNTYNYTGTGLPATQASVALTDSQTVSTYAVIVGSKSWTETVSYDAGQQPLSSRGNNYSTPLAAGTTSGHTVSITGVYPYYGTTAVITTYTKQALAAMNSTYVETDMVAENGLGDKQTADFPVTWSAITGVQVFNPISSTWDWIGGTKANSLLTFDVTSVSHTIQGNSINYNRYTNNSATVGARNLRWYTT
jgi:hypothetical protein